ncbi:glycoside hydrolase family 3 protein [Maribacter algarum]|uniref:beta-glucosidase n=1 Tax=Maribacter algarum (ex Zhang et al. 2020) TaxID=2578118 RepID=A0A5S3QMY4_9FLAO|nr:glycoside hydrolase family 3 N-terminal domain-containing protein [Maribacter algarum]TMM59264.1 glycoside hydrolase family 3 protein [Maribacter algarum]
MKKFLRITGKILGLLIVLLLLTYLIFWIKWKVQSSSNMKLAGEEAPTLILNGKKFRDLNKNGKLDPYEDDNSDIELRIDDLLSQMNLEEKAGTLFINMTIMRDGGELNKVPSITNPFSLLLEITPEQVLKKRMNHFNIMETPSAFETATWNNNLQKLAERTRLGIPVTIATDPRHGAGFDAGTGVASSFYSRWPSQLGMGATRDSALVHEFGNIARQEYGTLGLRLALHPMADLATEPRWTRVNGCFSEDAELAARLTEAYVLGFQGDSLTNSSVACMTKHFSGGGPQEDGWDAHFSSGKGQTYPGSNFDYHLIPFIEGALKAKTAQIMPYYGIPKGQTGEEVAFAFNKEIITGLLRDSLNFQGVICTDWGLVSDMPVKEASAWGVEHLSEKERVKKILDAGCDMLGGESRPDLVLQLLEEGAITEDRLDVSLRRIFRDKFRLGLFDNPYVDTKNLDVVGNPDFVEKGKEAQRKALVLLKNENNLLPLASDKKVYIEGMVEGLEKLYPQIVSNVSDADIIIKKLNTPSSPPIGDNLLERFFPQGRLDFPEEEKTEILELISSKPTITVLEMQRPPIVPDINVASKAVIADFDCQDEIILELIFGKFNPSGKLPIEIPSSVEAVENQMEDVPYDSKNPLYKFGHGLSY